MKFQIEQIDRMDRDFLKYVYAIRREVFERECKFPRKDRMVYNEWDALSKHFMLLVDGFPAGAIAVVDWTGLEDILFERGIDADLRIAKFTKLAILPQYRGVEALKNLINNAKTELKDFDYAVAEVAPPSNNLSDFSRYKLGDTYQRLFDLELISTPIFDGVKTHVLGRNLK